MPRSGDSVTVAASGYVDRPDKCPACGDPMFFHVNERHEIVSKFCGQIGCDAFLKEEADASE